MDKSEILAVIKKKVYYAELPSKMDVSVMDDTLHVIIDADGVLQNMQNDASAFEGWVFCIKSFFPNITNVIIDWEEPVLSLEEKVQVNQRKHFNRFLLRVVWFIENYPWATVAESKKETIEMLGENDRAMKYEAMLETAVYQYLSTLGNANHQLPMGLFDGTVSKATAITPGGASQADLWRIDHDKFYVYELKDCINSDNTHVGIITELMFYANVLYRLFITHDIQYPLEADKFRTDKREKASRGLELILDAIHHPLIEYAKEQLLSDMNQGMAAITFEHSTVLQLMPAELIPAPTYKELQGTQQIKVLQTLPQFKGIKGGGTWKAGLQNIQLPYIIEDGQEVTNIYPSIREAAIEYFRKNGIGWWKSRDAINVPTGHMLSSQISCVNHLFPFMKEEETPALLLVFNSIQHKYHFTRIIPNPLDRTESNGNVCFEFVWKNRALLGERTEKRGAMCTSIDAVIYAETIDRKRVLIPIEWKYVETYEHKRAPQVSIDRYPSRIHTNSNIPAWKEAYEYDPLYELVRQTLLVENIIWSKDMALPVDDYLHINVIPNGNEELRKDISTYAQGLKDASKFIVIDPKQLMCPIKDTHSDLYNYLDARYWQ